MTRAEGSSGIATVATVAVVVAALYFAKDFLLPLALAALVAFMLNPLVGRLERARVPRAVGVIAIILVLVSAVGLIAWLLASEVTSLAAGLPDFRENLVEKLRALRGPLRSLADALGWIDRLSKEIDPTGTHAQAAKVEIVESPNAMEALGRFVPAFFQAFATAGLVGVLALFILVQSDLPKRVSALFALRGSRISPRALREAGELVSGFLVRQAVVCALQGVFVAAGLALIGLPGALLFGAISALLRSIPYFGPATSAALPIAFSMAAFPGFEMALWTSAFFIALELFTSNVLDPRVVGEGAGLSPFGVILAATFWAWLWGPVGLLVAIPLTACFTVVGRYVPPLSFVPAFLARDLAVPPATQLYERLVAREVDEAAALLRQGCREGDLVGLSDELVLPMLATLAAERDANRCTRADQLRCLQVLRDLLAELVAGVPVPANGAAQNAVGVEELRGSLIDRFARDWVATVLERAGFAVVSNRDAARAVVFAIVGERGLEDALRSPRTAARLRGREALVIAASQGFGGTPLVSSATIVRSCAALVSALAPAPIARRATPGDTLEALVEQASAVAAE